MRARARVIVGVGVGVWGSGGGESELRERSEDREKLRVPPRCTRARATTQPHSPLRRGFTAGGRGNEGTGGRAEGVFISTPLRARGPDVHYSSSSTVPAE